MCDSVISELIDLKIREAVRLLAFAEHSHESAAEHTHVGLFADVAHEHPVLEAAITSVAEEAEEAADDAEEAAEAAEEAAEEAEEAAEEEAEEAAEESGDIPPVGMGEESTDEPETTPNHTHPLLRRIGG